MGARGGVIGYHVSVMPTAPQKPNPFLHPPTSIRPSDIRVEWSPRTPRSAYVARAIEGKIQAKDATGRWTSAGEIQASILDLLRPDPASGSFVDAVASVLPARSFLDRLFDRGEGGRMLSMAVFERSSSTSQFRFVLLEFVTLGTDYRKSGALPRVLELLSREVRRIARDLEFGDESGLPLILEPYPVDEETRGTRRDVGSTAVRLQHGLVALSARWTALGFDRIPGTAWFVGTTGAVAKPRQLDPLRDALEALTGKRPAVELVPAGTYYTSELPETVHHELQWWALDAARLSTISWSTGIGILEAADHVVREAVANANLPARDEAEVPKREGSW